MDDPSYDIGDEERINTLERKQSALTSGLIEHCVEWLSQKEARNFITLNDILQDTFRLSQQFNFLLNFAGLEESVQQCQVFLVPNDDQKPTSQEEQKGEGRKENISSTINPELLLNPAFRRPSFLLPGASKSQSLQKPTKNPELSLCSSSKLAKRKVKLKDEKIKCEIETSKEKLKKLEEENVKIMAALCELKKYTTECGDAQDILKECSLPDCTVSQDDTVGYVSDHISDDASDVLGDGMDHAII